jgi:hypothetical protein
MCVVALLPQLLPQLLLQQVLPLKMLQWRLLHLVVLLYLLFHEQQLRSKRSCT